MNRSYPPPPAELTDSKHIGAIKGFFENSVGSLALPDTYFKGGGVTRSTPTMLTDAIEPDWAGAVTWENDRILGTQVPAIITRTVEYAVLIQNRTDTVSFAIQTPHVWIMFNQRKDDGETLCFLATLLPDASYTGDPATIGSNPRGTDFWGIALYSRTDGTPMWGVRYEAGAATHELLFDSGSDVAVDPDISVGLGFGAGQLTRKGSSDDPILIDSVTCVGNRDEEDEKDGFIPMDQENFIWLPGDYGVTDRIGGGGSGGGGGGSTIKVGAPNADRLFNGNLTEQQWKALEAMINKIMADCMGGALYNSLVARGSYSLQINTGGTSSSFGSGGGIVLNKMESNALLHEMFHFYQYFQVPSATWDNIEANLDLEAAIAQYKYLQKLPEFTPGSQWAQVYNNTKIGQDIATLSGSLSNKGTLIDPTKSLEFNSLFAGTCMTIVDIYRNSSNYKPGIDLSFDPNRSVTDNLKHLAELSKNC